MLNLRFRPNWCHPTCQRRPISTSRLGHVSSDSTGTSVHWGLVYKHYAVLYDHVSCMLYILQYTDKFHCISLCQDQSRDGLQAGWDGNLFSWTLLLYTDFTYCLIYLYFLFNFEYNLEIFYLILNINLRRRKIQVFVCIFMWYIKILKQRNILFCSSIKTYLLCFPEYGPIAASCSGITIFNFLKCSIFET